MDIVEEKKQEYLSEASINQHQIKRKSKLFLLLTFFIILLLGITLTAILKQIYKQAIDETIKPVIPKTQGWKRYNSNGISFLYPPDWIILKSEKEMILGNEKRIMFERFDKDGRTAVLYVDIDKDYVSVPGLEDHLRSYLFGDSTSTPSADLKEIKFNNRRAIRYIQSEEDIFQDIDTMVIDIPEFSGVLKITFPHTNPELTIYQAAGKYFNPLLESLVIKNPIWPDIKPILTSSSSLNTSSWNIYTGTNFTMHYPGNWRVKEERDSQFDDIINVILTRIDSKEYGSSGKKLPQIIIGSPAIFSTSGALCGNNGPRECLNMGLVKLQIKEKTYYTTIIDKNFREQSASMSDFYPSYYVFALDPDRVPSTPRATAMLNDLKQGQEIVDILSTITY